MIINKRKSILVKHTLLVASLFFISCADGPAKDPSAPGSVYTGSAIGTVGGSAVNTTIEMTLYFNGNSVTGSYLAPNGIAGTITADASDPDNVLFTLTQVTPTTGTFTGIGVVIDAENRITGNFTGTDSASQLWNITFDVSKE